MFVVVFITIAVGASVNGYKIGIYAESHFRGEAKTIQIEGVTCINLIPEWYEKVKSVMTFGNCFELYDKGNCKGDVRYVYPGFDNEDLDEINFAEKVMSFRLCDLDEFEYCLYCRHNLNPKLPEYQFWVLLLGEKDQLFLNCFKENAAATWFIYWDFLPSTTGTRGEQYQSALEWALSSIQNENFDFDTLIELQKTGIDVFNYRHSFNRHHNSYRGTRHHAIDKQIENIWAKISQALYERVKELVIV